MGTNTHREDWKTYTSDGERVGVSYRPPSDTHGMNTTVTVDDRHPKRQSKTSTFGGGENG